MRAGKNVRCITDCWTTGSTSGLGRWLMRLGQLFAAVFHILRDLLQALAGSLRSGRNLLDMQKQVGIIQLLANLFQEGFDLGENKKHFAAAAGLHKELFVERALQNERSRHIPVAGYLAQPRIFLTAK